ncbi:uncharacterized protein EI97DRAFT_431729 [Westerdykella ornata]|uniref:J domain-containing protein n=1 Tax=Westerdykella ornata TaxID=318751 RepID=A0A6A6JPP7_WESOR|nr:uncharacterized protein EI97DRAFT_431729 [Westerdykella ornata]KAF2278502.1 hypothetical protein EI97DRAFT_431729 [Westerdykella ornata]
MPPKTPAILLSSGPSVAAFCCTSPPPPCSRCRHPFPPTQRPRQQRRPYAQHAEAIHEQPPRSSPSPSSSHPNPHPQPHYEEADLTWPTPIHPRRFPTPYQILCCHHGQPYTKRRFYALAKLYHPDSCHVSSPVAHVPPAVRLERYRLIVAAHGILSDDSKRRAYDLWGAGWAENPSHSPSHPYSPFGRGAAAETWSTEHDPLHNATWEDWERWHRRNVPKDDADSRTVYMSNFGFMSFILLAVSLGGIVQGTRANAMSSSVMEQREKVHREASLQLARSQHATRMTGDKKERVRSFLEHREATLAGHATYQRLLPPEENCGPESLRKHEGG